MIRIPAEFPGYSYPDTFEGEQSLARLLRKMTLPVKLKFLGESGHLIESLLDLHPNGVIF